MLNLERFVLFLEEYNVCEVKEHYFAINEFNEEEHFFLLETGEEVKLTIPNQEQ